MNLERRVVCAACKSGVDGRLYVGPRHFDHTMTSQIPEWDSAPCIQGFINTWGEFLTREEAWVVATHNNQIFRRVGGDEGKLFSENLY